MLCWLVSCCLAGLLVAASLACCLTGLLVVARGVNFLPDPTGNTIRSEPDPKINGSGMSLIFLTQLIIFLK
jgi:hypothetical protein